MPNFSFFAAIMASMMHVISGPDHLAAVTPLVLETKRKAWKIGLVWGFGHILGMLMIGVLFLLFREHIPVESISEHSEQLVGLVLIGVGAWAFYRIFNERKTHRHPHIHLDEKPYVHVHKHVHKHVHNTIVPNHEHSHEKVIRQNLLSSFGIGVLHGFAGIAHFLLLLPVLGFDSQWEGIRYIIGFGIGTIIAMTAYAMVLENIVKYSKQEHHRVFFMGIRLAGGLFALVVGIYWLYTGL